MFELLRFKRNHGLTGKKQWEEEKGGKNRLGCSLRSEE